MSWEMTHGPVFANVVGGATFDERKARVRMEQARATDEGDPELDDVPGDPAPGEESSTALEAPALGRRQRRPDRRSDATDLEQISHPVLVRDSRAGGRHRVGA